MIRVSRRARWAVPTGALLVTGGIMAATLMPAAQAAPALPSRTPAQLLASVAAQSQVPAFTGTVLETTSLGLPQLPGTQSPTSILSLLTGSHTIHVWYASPRQYRLALPGSMSETDLYRDGSTGWLWQSVPDTVTEFVLPAHPATKPEAQPPLDQPALTPQQAASAALAAVGPTTTVSVDSNVFVAGQPAYQLDLAPKALSTTAGRSLVGQVQIAIDARNNVPLRVRVFARHATSPAISVGFASVTFAAPSASDLAFAPPRGAEITTVNPPADRGSGSASSDGVSTTGSGWLTVLKLPSSLLTEATTAGGKQAASDAPISVNGGPGESAAALQALLGATTTVQGTWGSGQLLRTSLVSVLITNGTMYVGAVQPSVLYAAAAQH
jgi:hypothetical protein